ncbi:MAG: histidine phosphatase family protein [Nitrospirae bacterium]|nr:MAG: histidine phosphatase family protein [Nitrospirota bacterium]
MPKVILVRHGETDWNRSGQIMGRLPVPLNARGREQAKALAHALKEQPIAAIYSSPVLRCLQTAQIISAVLDIPLFEEPGLTEVDFGQWEQKFWSELAHDPIRQELYRSPEVAHPPGGETLSEVQQRAVTAVTKVVDSNLTPYPVMILSHADVLRSILGYFLHLSLEQTRRVVFSHAAGSVLEIQPDGGTWLHRLNCYSFVTP